MTANTTANTKSTVANVRWEDVDIKDRYEEGNFVVVSNHRGKELEVVQIAKVTPTRYSVHRVGATADGIGIRVFDTSTYKQYSRTTGQNIAKHYRHEFISGAALSEYGAARWMQGYLNQLAASRIAEQEAEAADALLKYDAAITQFGHNLDRGITRITVAGSDPLYQYTGKMVIRGVEKGVILQWSARRSDSDSPYRYSQISTDFCLMVWEADDRRWSGPRTWNSWVMSDETLAQCAEARGRDLGSFMMAMALGEACQHNL